MNSEIFQKKVLYLNRDCRQPSDISVVTTWPVMSYHICSNSIIEIFEVSGIIHPFVRIIWNVRFINLNQIISFLSLQKNISYIMSFHLRIMVGEHYQAYPVIVQNSIFYCDKLVGKENQTNLQPKNLWKLSILTNYKAKGMASNTQAKSIQKFEIHLWICGTWNSKSFVSSKLAKYYRRCNRLTMNKYSAY